MKMQLNGCHFNTVIKNRNESQKILDSRKTILMPDSKSGRKVGSSVFLNKATISKEMTLKVEKITYILLNINNSETF